MALFAILFGTRHIDATEHHQGLVAAIAFESVIKLVAFVCVGLFVTFVMFDGFGDLFARVAENPALARLTTMEPVAVAAADTAVDARDHLPASPVPGHRGREHRRKASEQGALALPALHAADQPLRAAHRTGGIDALPAGYRRRRHVCPRPADGGSPASAGAVRLHRRISRRRPEW